MIWSFVMLSALLFTAQFNLIFLGGPFNGSKIKQAYRIAGHVGLLAELRQEGHHLRVSSLSIRESGRKVFTVLFLVKIKLENLQKFFRVSVQQETQKMYRRI
jgi:hypothetical protein